ncbi:cation channel sperm-associated protein 4-like [Carcharodon carcharias]|uniref:cation channel sperm-associated protein 4-like n=1 Tax=Carcharodon carcharias TaxID=13397 RepID=UPI001B7DC315|nr:cation channel sperm-associated protein 4-like [Carcharodon carcharias]
MRIDDASAVDVAYVDYGMYPDITVHPCDTSVSGCVRESAVHLPTINKPIKATKCSIDSFLEYEPKPIVQELKIDFSNVIEGKDEWSVEDKISQNVLRRLLDHILLRSFIILLLLGSCIAISCQTDPAILESYAMFFATFEQILVTIFLWEMLLKWYYGFWLFWKDGWNIADFFVTSALFMGSTLSSTRNHEIFYVLRVLRALRMVRSLAAIQGLAIMVQVIVQSVSDMANIIFLLILITLVFAVFGVIIFSTNVPESFGSLEKAMYSLFICITQDGWVQIYEEFVLRDGVIMYWGALYLFTFIIGAAFIFANIMVAAVTSNLEEAILEQEEKKHILADESGLLTEFRARHTGMQAANNLENLTQGRDKKGQQQCQCEEFGSLLLVAYCLPGNACAILNWLPGRHWTLQPTGPYQALPDHWEAVFHARPASMKLQSSQSILGSCQPADLKVLPQDESESSPRLDLIHLNVCMKQINMAHKQQPMKYSSLENLNLTTYEEFCLVLEAIQRNLQYYKQIRHELNSIVKELRDILFNRDQQKQIMHHERRIMDMTEALLTNDMPTFKKKEMLSNLLTMEKVRSPTASSIFSRSSDNPLVSAHILRHLPDN